MGYLTSALVVAVVVGLLVLRRVLVVRQRANRDREWMPAALADAKLVWSEKTFRCEEPVPIVVRVDRVYRVGDGPLTLIEFKRRAVCRTYLSDVVELSAQRFVLQRVGHAVSRQAFIVVLPAGASGGRALPVELERDSIVVRRAARLRALVSQRAVPDDPVSAAVCRIPAAPASLSATDSATQVTVSWTAVSAATSYKVYRSTVQGQQGALIGSTPSTSLADSTVVNGTTYYFVVRASNAAGEGPASSAAVVTHGTAWHSAKFGGGGYVTGLIYHPTTANLLYARTDIGGAYRWDQANSTWIPITDGIGFGGGESSYHGIESIALDPNDDRLVYMAAGRSTTEGGRLYLSSDRGNHWTYVALPFAIAGNNNGRAIGERMVVDPNKPSTLFYGSRQAGLWKSVDSGHHWAQVTSLSSVTLTSAGLGIGVVLFDTATKGSGTATQTLYAAISPDYVDGAGLTSSLYRSTNGGTSWTPVTTPVTGYHIPHIVRAADGMFYVLFSKTSGPGSGGPGRLYKFDGSTWTLLNSIDFAGYGGVSVSGTGSTTRIALGVSGTFGDYSGKQVLQLSDNAGLTWREIETGMPGDTVSGWVDDVEINPSNRDHILHVHGGGVVETRNASASMPTWAATVNGIEETGVEDLVTPPPGAPYIVITSAGDVGAWVYTDLTQTPTRGPSNLWNNAFAADLAWSDPLYIATIGAANWNGHAASGYWSGDGGQTWASFATLAPGAASNPDFEASIAVTARNNVIWAPSNSVPSYTTDNGASWVATNLPPLPRVGTGVHRAYHLVADRNNVNKVYAYDSGGHWWGTAGKVYVSTDGGHTFSLSQDSVDAKLNPSFFRNSAMAVNPYVEGDLWPADGNAIYHSVDSGASWTRTGNFASVYTSNPWPAVYGATAVALGKAKAGATYSAAVYVVGVLDGVWGVYRSDDGGTTWTRFNDDDHQFGGIGVIAADHNVYGRLYVTGTGRGMLYSN